ncbi:MAG: hypothetical protein NT066_07060 [Candidatus Omnitrophica bacterium]|nr:hypothetical protein [Candidatus Omnitrophota bacterium]
MKLARIAVIALLVITVVSTVACSSTPTATCLSCEEAIALAQDEWNQALQQVPCVDGRNYWLSQTAQYTWSCDYQFEPDYTLVKYGSTAWGSNPYKWRVYCDTHIVAADGDTWNRLQTAISGVSNYYCD